MNGTSATLEASYRTAQVYPATPTHHKTHVPGGPVLKDGTERPSRNVVSMSCFIFFSLQFSSFGNNTPTEPAHPQVIPSLSLSLFLLLGSHIPVHIYEHIYNIHPDLRKLFRKDFVPKPEFSGHTAS